MLLLNGMYQKCRLISGFLDGSIKFTKRPDLRGIFMVFKVVIELCTKGNEEGFKILKNLHDILDDQDDLTMTEECSVDESTKVLTILLTCVYQFQGNLSKYKLFLDKVKDLDFKGFRNVVIVMEIDYLLLKSDYPFAAKMLIENSERVYQEFPIEVIKRWKYLYDALGNEKGKEMGLKLGLGDQEDEYNNLKQVHGRALKEGLLAVLKNTESQLLKANVLLDLSRLYKVTAKSKSKAMWEKGVEIAKSVGNLEVLARYGIGGLEEAVEGGRRVLMEAGVW